MCENQIIFIHCLHGGASHRLRGQLMSLRVPQSERESGKREELLTVLCGQLWFGLNVDFDIFEK